MCMRRKRAEISCYHSGLVPRVQSDLVVTATQDLRVDLSTPVNPTDSLFLRLGANLKAIDIENVT